MKEKLMERKLMVTRCTLCDELRWLSTAKLLGKSTRFMQPNNEKKVLNKSSFLLLDSVRQQPEMLLNPGSRMVRNGRLAQSTGELDANSAYSARGPQRDFSTLPPYHEPPSFEEAMRQSGRKPKTRKSTGDLTGPGQGRHSGRRPRQARPADEPTDSSDGEQRFTPQRSAPPPPRVRLVLDSSQFFSVIRWNRKTCWVNLCMWFFLAEVKICPFFFFFEA